MFFKGRVILIGCVSNLVNEFKFRLENVNESKNKVFDKFYIFNQTKMSTFVS
jgi:hypothetical protein